ncbi:Poly(U)-specific endoribonuclease [Armadillidium nasatum]|uniref:Poly(U)-specific endoribonuclease n=1 Tax=Armadillidium nasatum TaxID=96803 RepID=A0A5N5TMR9_9CRUS|nr:Poly(U)-specific endoribonuclease [Armadillidium nasatum]
MKSIIVITFLLAAVLQWTHVVAQSSCSDRCGESGDSSTCWCNNQCEDFSDCCSDYSSLCLSCQDRCGESYSSSKPCQCNSACGNNYDCCDDYSSECGGGGGGATDADVIALTEELYELDLSFLVGDKITIDQTPPGP